MKPLQRCSDGLCGATDCPRCTRGCDDWTVECDACGDVEYVCHAGERGWAGVDDAGGPIFCPTCQRYANLRKEQYDY